MPKAIIPQNQRVLRQLRAKLNLSQNKMADALSEAFFESTGIHHVIQQPDVCRLENGSAAIDFFKLLAYSKLCNVEISDLIQGKFKSLLNHNADEDIQIKAFLTDTDAENHLTKIERKERLLISSNFPSSFFRLTKDSKRYQQLASPDYVANELYTIDAFINFLFSPVSEYSLGAKKELLEEYISYFQGNNFRQLNFFPRSILPEYSQLTYIELLPEQEVLLIPGPISHSGEGDVFIEIRDKKVYADITRFYRSLQTFENSMIYLRIGLAALERMSDDSPAREAINMFAIEILQTRDLNAIEAIKCFSPEIQKMLKT